MSPLRATLKTVSKVIANLNPWSGTRSRYLGADIYERIIQIRISSEKGLKQLVDFEHSLRQLDDLKIMWSGGSSDEGPVMSVLLRKPTTLVRLLKELCTVESVDEEGGSIIVRLKDTPVA